MTQQPRPQRPNPAPGAPAGATGPDGPIPISPIPISPIPISPIPISAVHLGAEAEALVIEVLRSGQLAQGPMVARLEDAFRAISGTRHAIAVANGTLALVAALQAVAIEPGDEVVTSPFTFIATVNAALEAGARVRFADIEPDTFTVDPDAVAAVSSDATAVVMPVHLYGHPADMPALRTIAQRHGAALVEDAAQAHGARIDGRPVGSFGVGCFSLYATKNVTTGEGGIVTTDDDAIADRLRLLRNQGMRLRYQYELPGHNYRLTDLQAAVGIPQVERLDETTDRRAANAAFLCEALAGIDGLVLPTERAGCRHVWHQFTVRVTDDARIDRDTLAARLTERGIGNGIYYPKVVFDYEAYRDHPMVEPADVPNAVRAAREVLSLPVHPALTANDLGRIAAEVSGLLS